MCSDILPALLLEGWEKALLLEGGEKFDSEFYEGLVFLIGVFISLGVVLWVIYWLESRKR